VLYSLKEKKIKLILSEYFNEKKLLDEWHMIVNSHIAPNRRMTKKELVYMFRYLKSKNQVLVEHFRCPPSYLFQRASVSSRNRNQ